MKMPHRISWILQILVAALLTWAGAIKLMSHPTEVEIFTALDMEPYGRYFIGVLEIVAAGSLIIPRTIAYGAMLTWGLMVGAVLAHFSKLGYTGDHAGLMLLAFATLIACSCIIYLRRGTVHFLAHPMNTP